MRILVTGSRGFVGGAFGAVAAREGHEILGVSRSSQPAAGWPGAHAQADVANADLSGLVREFAPDMVLHGAGAASVGNSLTRPLDDLRASLLTWANTLDSIRRSGTQPVIVFPSSAAVYGNPTHLPVSEDALCAPISPYGFHKAACELIAQEYAQCFAQRVVICRLFSVFGPGQRRLLAWEIFRQLADSEDGVWLEGTGAESRDYLHIDDVALAMLRLGEKQTASGCLTINVASGNEIPILTLAEEIRDLAAVSKEIRCRGHARAGDPMRWCADTTRLRSLLSNWEPKPIRAALGECISAWQRGLTRTSKTNGL